MVSTPDNMPRRYPPRRRSKHTIGEVDGPSRAKPAEEADNLPFYSFDEYRERPSAEDAKTTSPASELQQGTDEAVQRFADNLGAYEAPQPTEPVPPQTPADVQPTQSSVDLLTDTATTTAALSAKSIEARRQRKRKRRMKTTAVLGAVVGLVLVVAITTVSFFGGLSLFTGAADYEGTGTGHVVVTIPEGATGTDIAAILKEKDVVASEKAFIDAYKNNSLAQGIQAGSYNLKKKMKASKALAYLLDPKYKAEVRVTVIPGTTVEQIKERVVAVKGFSEEEVDKALKDTKALGLPAQANGNLEGWLAPETYTIEPGMTPQDLFKEMINTTVKNLDQLGIQHERREAFLTRASIVQKEGDHKEYYGKIARVIENRITRPDAETHGLLQMDCTVAYGVGKAGTGLLINEADKRKDTPYNTYIHKGLPPTPIANASLDVMKAVANPPKGDWLFYVTVNLETGETKFANTLAEQEANVKQFRKYCQDNPDMCKS